MWWWLKAGAIIVGFVVLNVVISNVVTKREEQQDRDEAAEQARAERISQRAGHALIVLAHAGAGLIAFASGMGFFFSLVDGRSWSLIAEMAIIFAASIPVYFWFNRITRALP
jgi:hypothetical protein